MSVKVLTMTKCDRCGKEHVEDSSAPPPKGQQYKEPPNFLRVQAIYLDAIEIKGDLCDACASELAVWLKVERKRRQR